MSSFLTFENVLIFSPSQSILAPLFSVFPAAKKRTVLFFSKAKLSTSIHSESSYLLKIISSTLVYFSLYPINFFVLDHSHHCRNIVRLHLLKKRKKTSLVQCHPHPITFIPFPSLAKIIGRGILFLLSPLSNSPMFAFPESNQLPFPVFH